MSDERDLLPIADWRATARLALQMLERRRARLVAAITAFAAAALLGLVAPWVLGRMVDAVDGTGDRSEIVTYAVVIAVAGLLGGVLTFASGALLAGATEPAVAELREEVVDRALGLDAARVESAGAGDLLSRVGEDVRKVADGVVQLVPYTLSAAMAVAFTVVGLFALDWRLAIAGLATAPLYYWSLRWYLPRSGPYYAKERVAEGELTETLVTGLHSAATLRAFSREADQVDRIQRASRRSTQLALDVFVVLTRFFARNNAVECVGLVTILVTGYVLVDAESATVGQVTAAALFFHRLFNPIGGLLTVFDELQSAGASLARLAGIVAMPAAVGVRAPRPADAALRLTSIRHKYDGERIVLDDVTVQVAPGERVAIVGESGAGKTTLGAIAAGLLRPSSGHVTIGDRAVPDDVDRRHLTLVTQEVHVFSGTVRANVDLARPDATDGEVRDALATVGAWPWVSALPSGWDTVIGEHGHALTAAQAQQLALARVVLLDPAVVVLDEATAEAGSSGARDLEAAAFASTSGRTALVIAHRLTQSQTSDRVVVLHQGEVVEQGTHDELVQAGGRYAELWHAWSGETSRGD